MDGLSHGLQEELIVCVKAPVGTKSFWIVFHKNLLFNIVPYDSLLA